MNKSILLTAGEVREEICKDLYLASNPIKGNIGDRIIDYLQAYINNYPISWISGTNKNNSSKNVKLKTYVIDYENLELAIKKYAKTCSILIDTISLPVFGINKNVEYENPKNNLKIFNKFLRESLIELKSVPEIAKELNPDIKVISFLKNNGSSLEENVKLAKKYLYHNKCEMVFATANPSFDDETSYRGVVVTNKNEVINFMGKEKCCDLLCKQINKIYVPVKHAGTISSPF